MGKNRIVIVDDSPFSISLIRDILEENDFEVVGTAGTLDEVVDVISQTKPDLVTMDMTLPGTDGFECTRAVHSIDKSIDVIVISSMMDDELLFEAQKNNIAAYVQKPVDSEELITAINRILATEELFQFLSEQYIEVFKETLLNGFNKMAKSILEFKSEYPQTDEFNSNGISIIVGIIGKFSGRMILDISQKTSSDFAASVLKRELKSNEELFALLSEFSNIVAGNACSILNKKNKSLGLRVAPPSVLSGDEMKISAADYNTTTIVANSVYGEITLNIGFQKGEF